MEGLPAPQTTTDFYLKAILEKLETMSAVVPEPSSEAPGEVELREPAPRKKGKNKGRIDPDKE